MFRSRYWRAKYWAARYWGSSGEPGLSGPYCIAARTISTTGLKCSAASSPGPVAQATNNTGLVAFKSGCLP